MYIVNIIDFFHRSIHMYLPRVKPSPAFTINFACGVFFCLLFKCAHTNLFYESHGGLVGYKIRATGKPSESSVVDL